MVVEIPFSALAGGTLKMGTLVVREIRAAYAVTEQFKELGPKLNIIKALHFEHAYDKEEMQEESPTVQAWLTWVSDVAYYAEDLSDEFEIHQLQRGGIARKVGEFFSSNNKYVFYFKVSKKFEKIKADVDQIVNQTLDFLDNIEGRRNSRRETHKKKEMRIIRVGKGLINGGIAALLGSKTEESERLPLLNSEHLCSPGDQNYTTALVNYNNLDLPTYLKPCFAYCALFPTDYKIKKKLLVQMWIAQGYIRSLDKDSEEDLGNRYFEELVSKSLLVVFEKDANDNILSYKMHDPNTNSVRAVKGSEVLILKSDTVKIEREFRHVSLFNSVNLKGKPLNLEHIRTFLTIPGYCKYKDDFIRRIVSLNFKRLRVLSLHGCKTKRLPKFIGRLCHLRYLDLSYNDVEKIPKSVTRLKCLQTLRVVGCENLKRLRRDTREMTSLRHLENDECPSMSKMPFGIGELTELRSLSVFVVGDVKKECWVGRLSELKELNNLRGELSIVNLENANADESREANLSAKKYLKFLRLEWRGGGDVESASVLEGLLHPPPPNLKGLCIKGYGGQRLEIRNFHQLASLELQSCPRLSELKIYECPSLASVKVPPFYGVKVELHGVREEVRRQLRA